MKLATLPRQKMMFTGAEEKTEHKTRTNSKLQQISQQQNLGH